MTAPYLGFNSNTQHGMLLRAALTGGEDSIESLKDIKGTMALMIDGDGSQDAHYDLVTVKFGFANNTASHNAFNELSTMVDKLTTDSSTSGVNAALTQGFNKFR